MWLIMATCINSIMYLDKNHEVFPLELVHVVYQMTEDVRYASDPYINAQMYMTCINLLWCKRVGK